MNFLRGRLLILSILLTGVNAVRSAGFLVSKHSVKTIYNNGFQMTEGGNVESWILRIMNGDTFACGASYYSPRIALTSANCIHAYRHRLAELNIKFSSTNEEDPEDEVRILTVYVSKDWRWTENYMDIAVVKLSHHLREHFKNFVQLCRKPLDSHHRLMVVGCDIGPDEDLRSEQIEILGRMECEDRYGNFVLGETLACAKELIRSPGCMFDAGCPVISDSQLCGIVSSGPACKSGLPGLFTDVYEVRRFISNAV
ncbi:hypothetical protein KR026_000143, partial [Drosophila bipectinata]